MNNNRNTPNGQNRQNGQRPTGQRPANQRPANQRPAGQRPSGQRPTSQQYPPQNQYRRMNETYDSYPPVRHRSRKQAERARALVILTVVILVMLVVALVIFMVRCASGAIGGGGTTESTSDTAPVTSAEPVTETTEPVTETTAPPQSDYEYKQMSASAMHKGYLILVNYQNAYTFETDFKIQPFYGNKNSSYKLRDTIVSLDSYAMEQCNAMMAAFDVETGNHDILINSAYRTKEDQEAIYNSYIEEYGQEYADDYVALPGYSEHHTGLAIDFTIYQDNGQAHTFDELTSYPEWLNTNGHKYGFVQRFKADKVDITKISYESWHYRYVGKPHAFYMVTNNLCLEEYIDALRSFPYDGTHLQITDDEGAKWEIYFVKAAAEGDTSVPVPKNYPYTVSGNNVDGFIVTVQK